jgi:hypothetical protein
VLRRAADVVATSAELADTVDRALREPERRAAERREAVNEVFYDPGQATVRALDLCYELIDGAASTAHAGITAWPERP